MLRVDAGACPFDHSGLSRRSFVQLGVAGLASLGLPGLMKLKEASANNGIDGRDTRVILIWLDGGPSHMDLYDLKPDAPAEYRGMWRPIKTNVPGMRISELFPKQAKVADKFSIIRSIWHNDGDHFGGALTSVLMWLLLITVVSGLVGAALQHFVPRVMTTDVKLETIYDEIGNVQKLLREEADGSVESLCGPLGVGKSAKEDVQRAGGFGATRVRPAIATGGAVATAAETVVLSEEDCAPLRKFYLDEMRPFLERPKEHRGRLRDADKAHGAFAGLQTLMPAAAHETLQDLEDICDEARQLLRQEQLHHLLHGWLLVHIPLSLALILLGAVHAVMALRY